MPIEFIQPLLAALGADFVGDGDDGLRDAREKAVRLAHEYALRYAERMGYGRFGLDIRVRDRSAPSAFAGRFISIRGWWQG